MLNLTVFSAVQFSNADALIFLITQSKSTFLRRLTQNGFRETRKRYKYIVVSDYSNKEYQKQEDLLKAVGISHTALNRYFNGKGRLIKQLGIKIKKQEVI